MVPRPPRPPRKPPGDKAARVLFTINPELLKQADRYARRPRPDPSPAHRQRTSEDPVGGKAKAGPKPAHVTTSSVGVPPFPGAGVFHHHGLTVSGTARKCQQNLQRVGIRSIRAGLHWRIICVAVRVPESNRC